MKVAACAVLISLWTGSVFAENQEPPVVAPPTPEKQSVMPARLDPRLVQSVPRERSQDPVWLFQIEKIRTFPRAGEIQYGPCKSAVSDVFKLEESQQAKVKKLMEDYDAAVLLKSKLWIEEMATLRAECEKQVLENMPETQREKVRKVLELSHKNWLIKSEMESQYRNDAIVYQAECERKKIQVEQDPEGQKELAQQSRAWHSVRRKAMSDVDVDVNNQLRALVSPEEAILLEKRSTPLKVPAVGPPNKVPVPLPPQPARPVPSEKKPVEIKPLETK